jgi:putative phosphoribosyl transferase
VVGTADTGRIQVEEGVVVSFIDRTDAGRLLGGRLRQLRGRDVVVLGLPRGGVPVAAEVARALGAPLDVVIVRKLGVPSQPELAVGAVGEDAMLVVNERVAGRVHLSEAEFAELQRRGREEVQRQAWWLRGDRPRQPLAGKIAVVVDDGIATGSTARAACRVVRAQGAARVVLATPVCAPETARMLRSEVDEVVCLETPAWFGAVGQFYVDFRQTSDDEVVELLRRGARAVPVPADDSPGDDGPADEQAEAADAAAEQAGRAGDPGVLPDPDGRSGQQLATALPPPRFRGGQAGQGT